MGCRKAVQTEKSIEKKSKNVPTASTPKVRSQSSKEPHADLDIPQDQELNPPQASEESDSDDSVLSADDNLEYSLARIRGGDFDCFKASRVLARKIDSFQKTVLGALDSCNQRIADMEKNLLAAISTPKCGETEQLALEIMNSELPTDMCLGPATNPITTPLTNQTSTIDHTPTSAQLHLPPENCAALSLTENHHPQSFIAQSTAGINLPRSIQPTQGAPSPAPAPLAHQKFQATATANGNISTPVHQPMFDALAEQFPNRIKFALQLFKLLFPIAEAVECNVNGIRGYKKLDENRLNVIITQSFSHFPIVNKQDWEKEVKELHQELNNFNRNQRRAFKKSATK